MIVFVLFAISAKAERPCLDLNQYFQKVSQTSQWKKIELRDKISAFHQRTLQSAHQKASLLSHPGFTLSGKQYLVIAKLGTGAEGTSYLAKSTEGRLVTIKQFFSIDALTRINQFESKMKQLKQKGVRVPEIYEIDRRQFVIIKEYIPGLDMLKVNNHAHEIGLTRKEKQQLTDQYQEFRRRIRRTNPELNVKEQNVLLDLRTGTFVAFDPF